MLCTYYPTSYLRNGEPDIHLGKRTKLKSMTLETARCSSGRHELDEIYDLIQRLHFKSVNSSASEIDVRDELSFLWICVLYLQ